MPVGTLPDLTYQDVVLAPLISSDIEDQAVTDIDTLGTFPEAWRARLILLRIYILVCLDYASTSDDPFSVKLAFYRAEYDEALPLARAASLVTATTSFFSVPLERA